MFMGVSHDRRFHLCQTGAGSQGARDFIMSSYASIKTDNPGFPFLIREAEGVQAKLIARYGASQMCPSGFACVRTCT